MNLHAALILALAATLAAPSVAQAQTVLLDGLQIVAKPATLRFNDVSEVDMVWQVTDESGRPYDRRIGVSGCAIGEGELIFFDQFGAREYHELLEWHVDEDDSLAEIGRVTCEIASRI